MRGEARQFGADQGVAGPQDELVSVEGSVFVGKGLSHRGQFKGVGAWRQPGRRRFDEAGLQWGGESLQDDVGQEGDSAPFPQAVPAAHARQM